MYIGSADKSRMAEQSSKDKFQLLYIWKRGLVFDMELVGGQNENKGHLSECNSFVS